MSAAPTPGTPPAPTTPTGPWARVKAHPIKVTVWLLIGIAIFVAAYIFVPKLYRMISNTATDSSPPPATALSDGAAKPADPVAAPAVTETTTDFSDPRKVNLAEEDSGGNPYIGTFANTDDAGRAVPYTIEIYLNARNSVPIVKKSRMTCWFVPLPNEPAPTLNTPPVVVTSTDRIQIDHVQIADLGNLGVSRIEKGDNGKLVIEIKGKKTSVVDLLSRYSDDDGKCYGLIQFSEFNGSTDTVTPAHPIKCWFRIPELNEKILSATTKPTK